MLVLDIRKFADKCIYGRSRLKWLNFSAGEGFALHAGATVNR